MPFTDTPVRHKADIMGLNCSRCGEPLPAGIDPLATVCKKSDGWIRGDVAWARDCGGSVVQIA